jgi:hypothetical protein
MKNKVKALKHNSQQKLAVVNADFVYFSKIDGEIFKHFRNERFDAQHFCEVVDFPVDFNVALEKYKKSQITRQQQKELEKKMGEEAQYKRRKEDILNLWRWRHGEVECYVVTSYKWVVDDYLNWDMEEFDYNLFFDIDRAKEAFGKTVDENKDFGELGYRFYVELTKIQTTDKAGKNIDVPVSERLQATTVDGIYEEFFQHSDAGGLEREVIEQPLPEDAVIVTFDHDGGYKYARLPKPGECTGDLMADRDQKFHDSEEVYQLSELNVSDNESLLMYIIGKLDLNRKDLQQYFDNKMLDILFEEEEEEEEEEDGNE